ncbi:hypothetical protein NM688_g4187 [Phlebia brevispora]|uniref:Uncharacterized protein n=1 Tax=Phlebia brevispora TaxID=194682 RepID=A0ACC1T3G3_9APHY|nr:hypothetical protein NM688_g4187 [Phlebia brevispora]
MLTSSSPCGQGHIFCGNCLESYIASSELADPPCPTCRAPIRRIEQFRINVPDALRPYIHATIRRVYPQYNEAAPPDPLIETNDDRAILEERLAEALRKIDELTVKNALTSAALEGERQAHAETKEVLDALRQRIGNTRRTSRGWAFLPQVWPFSSQEEEVEEDIGAQDVQLEEQERLLAAKDERLAEQERLLRLKDARIQEQQRLLREKDARIESKGRKIEQLRRQVQSIGQPLARDADQRTAFEDHPPARRATSFPQALPRYPDASSSASARDPLGRRIRDLQLQTPPPTPSPSHRLIQTTTHRGTPRRSNRRGLGEPQASDYDIPMCTGEDHVWSMVGTNGAASKYTCTLELILTVSQAFRTCTGDSAITMMDTVSRANTGIKDVGNFILCMIGFVVAVPKRLLVFFFNCWYVFVEAVVIFFFKPRPPHTPELLTHPYGRIAVIGSGLTGVSSAAHAIAHGFEVVIFEQSDKIGGIWANVNATSGLQLNSLLYRFHPGVRWPRAFPQRDEILSEITRIWRQYQLEPRTRFNTRVTSARRASREEVEDLPDEDDLVPEKQGHARWIINDGREGVFDAIIVTVGTCGKPHMVSLPGMPGWKEEKAQEDHEFAQQNGAQQDQANEGTGQEKPRNVSAGEEKPTQDGVWAESKPKEDAWNVGHDQVQKKEEGFPTPGEAFQAGSDIQQGMEQKSLAHAHHKHARKAAEDRKKAHKDQRHKHEHDVFKGPILHSSQLDREDAPSFKGKTVVVIGGGASAVESVETALAQGADHCIMLVRDDKWIIPRNIFIDTLIALQPFGREMPMSFIWEQLITRFNYYGVSDLTPAHLGLFESTPVVNDEFLHHVRKGRCEYVRADTERLTPSGVLVNVRDRTSKPGDEGVKKEIHADIVVLATGFKKPEVDFLPEDLFPEGYDRPNLYLQTFSTEDWSILMTNSAYMNAIGTVGHFHIGIYARILMTFLMDRNARPTPKDMKLWVDCVRFIKRGAKGGALGFFTYMELVIWLVIFHIFRFDRLKWLFFILQGWGVFPTNK